MRQQLWKPVASPAPTGGSGALACGTPQPHTTTAAARRRPSIRRPAAAPADAVAAASTSESITGPNGATGRRAACASLLLAAAAAAAAPAARAAAAAADADVAAIEEAAYAAYADRKFSEAARLLDSIASPGDPRWQEMRAQVLVDGKDFAGGIAGYTEALRLSEGARGCARGTACTRRNRARAQPRCAHLPAATGPATAAPADRSAPPLSAHNAPSRRPHPRRLRPRSVGRASDRPGAPAGRPRARL